MNKTYTIKFPAHKAELILSHNSNKTMYQSVQDYTDHADAEEWVNEEQKLKAYETQDYWELHWWPDTPVGSYQLLAADLDVLLARALEISEQDEKSKKKIDSNQSIS